MAFSLDSVEAGANALFVVVLCAWYLLLEPRHSKRADGTPVALLPAAAPEVVKHGATPAAPEHLEAQAAPGQAVVPSQAAGRAHYLDAIKAFLTIMVVTHHIVCEFSGQPDTGSIWCAGAAPVCQSGSLYVAVMTAFLGLQQSYFMAMFFFITAYFTPSSFDRKGTTAFMADRCKRIGIPALVYLWVFAPLCNLAAYLWAFGGVCGPDASAYPSMEAETCYYYSEYSGQTWYLYWLLILSAIYAWSHSSPSIMGVPKLGCMLLCAVAHGLWFSVIPFSADSFFMMPGGISELVSYILFFVGGILAKRNNWLPALFSFSTQAVWLLRGLATVCSLFCFCVLVGSVHYGGADIAHMMSLFYFLAGFFAIVFSLVLLQFFHLHFNGGSAVAKFFGDNAYAVYLLHYVFLNFSMWTWAKLLGSRVQIWASGASEVLYVMPAEHGGGDESWLWLGTLYCLIVTQMLVWPAAHIVRKLPGVRRVL